MTGVLKNKFFIKKIYLAVFVIITAVFLFHSTGICQTVSVEGRDIEIKSSDGVDYISLKTLSKKLGLSVKYFPESKMYKVTDRDKREIRFVADKRAVVVGDTFIRSTNPVVESGDDVDIPLEIISGLYSVSTSSEAKKNSGSEKPLSNNTSGVSAAPGKPEPLPVDEESDTALNGDETAASGDSLLVEDEDTLETAVAESDEKIDSHEAVIENIKYRRNTDSFELDIAFDGPAPEGVKYSNGMDGKNIDIIINKVNSKLGEQLIKITENIVESVKLTMVNQENSNRVILSLVSNTKVNAGFVKNGNMITFTVKKTDVPSAGELKPLIAETAASDTQSIEAGTQNSTPQITETGSEPKKAPGMDVLKSTDKIEVKLANIDELISGLGDRDDIIAIDAGHGGEEFGVVSENRLKEKDAALDIARRLKALMDKTKLRAILVRSGDYFMPVENRLKVINTYDTNLLISLHAGGAVSSDASGIGLYYYDTGARSSAASPLIASNSNVIDTEVAEIMASLNSSKKIKDSKLLAETIGDSIRKTRGLKVRNIKGANFSMLSECIMPAVMLEAGFITNREDEKALMSDEYKDKTAAAIFEGIKNYLLNVKK